MTYLDPDFQKKLKTLPEDLQRAILNLDIHQKMLDIWSKYDLLISDGDVLYKEVERVLSGESKAAGFPERVSPHLREVDKEIFPKIMADLDNEIFQPIKQDLIRIEALKNEDIKKDETEEDHLKLNKDDILSGIEKPIPSSLHSREAKDTEETGTSVNDGEMAPFEEIIEEVANKTDLITDSGEEVTDSLTETSIKPANSLTDSVEKLKKEEGWQSAIDAKRAEDLKKNLTGEGSAAQTPGVTTLTEVKSGLPSIVDTKLTQIVKSPKEEIDVKAPDAAAKRMGVDPYREPAN